jgi:hypothetical protein
VDAPDLRAHFEPQLGVQIGQRLVHQHERRLHDDRSRDRDTLLLSAGNLARQLRPLRRKPHQSQCLVHPPLDLRPGPPLHLQAEGNVPPHGHVREQRVVLKHHAEAALLRTEQVDALLVQPDAARCQRQ